MNDAYDRWEEFMDGAVQAVIMDELAKVPPNLRPFKGAELNFRKRVRFDVERRHYVQFKGCVQLEVECRSSGSQFIEVAPPGFSLAPRTPWSAGAYSVARRCCCCTQLQHRTGATPLAIHRKRDCRWKHLRC